MDDFSDAEGPLPDIYRSRQAFFASLPAWRRFLAKINWRPTIDLMVKAYHLQQEAARRDQAQAAPSGRIPSDPLLAELNAELSRRAGHAPSRTVASTLASSPKLELVAAAPAPPAPRRQSWRNRVKASLLLLLGIGIAVPLFWSGAILLLLLVGIPAFILVVGLGGLWKAIYDTLEEGDQPPPP